MGILNFSRYQKPTFLIIGAQKAGTSTLFDLLQKHSRIQGSTTKEIHYFDQDPFLVDDNYRSYHRNFLFHKKAVHYFEATPKYLFHPQAAERIHAYNPKLKLIISLRDPAHRALSAWTMFHHNFKDDPEFGHLYDPRTFQQAINDEFEGTPSTVERQYIARGRYALQLKRYFKLFPSEQVLIFQAERFFKDPQMVLTEVFDFLEVPSETIPIVKRNTASVDTKKEHMEELAFLNAYFRPDNEELYHLLEERYPW